MLAQQKMMSSAVNKMISQPSIDYIHDLFLSHVSGQKQPCIYATCGIPGAGKSHFVDMKLARGDFPSDAYILNPDRVMVELPDYKNDVDKFGAQSAYQKWELPVRNLAYDMADQALQMRGNIIKDMGCANPLSLDLIKRAKNNGYKISMFYIQCDTDEAFRRIDQREFKISKDEVIKRLHSLESLIPQYQSIADEFITLQNTDISAPYQIAA